MGLSFHICEVGVIRAPSSGSWGNSAKEWLVPWLSPGGSSAPSPSSLRSVCESGRPFWLFPPPTRSAQIPGVLWRKGPCSSSQEASLPRSPSWLGWTRRPREGGAEARPHRRGAPRSFPQRPLPVPRGRRRLQALCPDPPALLDSLPREQVYQRPHEAGASQPARGHLCRGLPSCRPRPGGDRSVRPRPSCSPAGPRWRYLRGGARPGAGQGPPPPGTPVPQHSAGRGLRGPEPLQDSPTWRGLVTCRDLATRYLVSDPPSAHGLVTGAPPAPPLPRLRALGDQGWALDPGAPDPARSLPTGFCE